MFPNFQVELQDPWSIAPSAGHATDEIKLGDRYASHLQRGMFDLYLHRPSNLAPC